MKDRIKLIRKKLHLTQTEFGERIGVKGNTITGYETGLRTPSDSVILSICKEFGVNEKWLRDNDGPMEISTDREARISCFIGQAMRGENATDIQHILCALMGATPDELSAIAKFAQRLAEEYKKEDGK